MRSFNVFAPGGEGPEWDVGGAVGAEQMSARLYALADDERSSEYHFHHSAEEWLLVLDGSPRVRTPDGERALEAGDVVWFPAGPGGAHELRGPGTVVVFAEQVESDAVELPERGVLELRPAGARFHREEAG